ncbi:MAG TPA: hypothetical protein VFA89_03665 [Terriglobales bacterium]|nr:hypothetical protein [Terriglobales bacterium]
MTLICSSTTAWAAKQKFDIRAQHPPKQKVEATGKSNASVGYESHPEINVGCLHSRMENPQESFSYFFAKDTSNDIHVSQEADVTPKVIDGRFRAEGNEHAFPFHGVRSNSQSWTTAVFHVTGSSEMSNVIGVLLNSSAIKREGNKEPVNGYDTIHYSIDTTRWSEAERERLQSSLGLGAAGTEKGDAWVTAEGCPVKLVLDTESIENDGRVIESVHFEESMVKN